jgi:hypothetical protein
LATLFMVVRAFTMMKGKGSTLVSLAIVGMLLTGGVAWAANPDESCTIDAPQDARAAAQTWCQSGGFTKISVSYDANNFIVVLQLSKKGHRAYKADKMAWLQQFRRMTDEMVQKTETNAAFSIHDPAGKLIGGCTRNRQQAASTCRMS